MSKPCKIPRDLKPGDRLWYSKTQSTIVENRAFGQTPYDGDFILTDNGESGPKWYRLSTGEEIDNDTPPIIRIERIASKPKKAKVDRDAAVIFSISETLDYCGTSDDGSHLYDFIARIGSKRLRVRLRAIARRLNGGKLP